MNGIEGIDPQRTGNYHLITFIPRHRNIDTYSAPRNLFCDDPQIPLDFRWRTYGFGGS